MLLVYLCAKNSHPKRGTASLCIPRLERRPDHAEGKVNPQHMSAAKCYHHHQEGETTGLKFHLSYLCDSPSFNFLTLTIYWGTCTCHPTCVEARVPDELCDRHHCHYHWQCLDDHFQTYSSVRLQDTVSKLPSQMCQRSESSQPPYGSVLCSGASFPERRKRENVCTDW